MTIQPTIIIWRPGTDQTMIQQVRYPFQPMATEYLMPLLARAPIALVCGGREFRNQDWGFMVLDQIDRRIKIETIVHGVARGADLMAASWADSREKKNWPFAADWKKYGGDAGPKRNQRMLAEAKPDVVIAFPGGRGTADMRRRAVVSGVPLIEFT